MEERKRLEIAICDDEVWMTANIEQRVGELSTSYKIEVDVDVFFDGKALTDYIIQGKRYDLIYLDIVMKEDGVTAARNIRKYDKKVLIIFVSNYESYAKEAFEVSAYRFITKPIHDSLFHKYFISAVEELMAHPIYYYYQYKKVTYKVLISDIIYFQSDKRFTYIVTENGYKKCYEKLNDIEKKLENVALFIRIHQSFLVNPKYIDVYKYNSVMLFDGTVLNISEKRSKTSGELYLKYKEDKFGV